MNAITTFATASNLQGSFLMTGTSSTKAFGNLTTNIKSIFWQLRKVDFYSVLNFNVTYCFHFYVQASRNIFFNLY